MRPILALLALAFIAVGCSSLKDKLCNAATEKAAAVAADVITDKLQCANKFAVKADMDALVKGIGICKAKTSSEPEETGMIADLVCPALVKGVTSKLAGALPAEWACSATDAKETLGAFLEAACKKIPVKSTFYSEEQS